MSKLVKFVLGLALAWLLVAMLLAAVGSWSLVNGDWMHLMGTLTIDGETMPLPALGDAGWLVGAVVGMVLLVVFAVVVPGALIVALLLAALGIAFAAASVAGVLALVFAPLVLPVLLIVWLVRRSNANKPPVRPTMQA